MKKTIEQRAKERLSNYIDSCYLHKSEETEDAYLVGFYDGAISQRKIDINKACEWLYKNRKNYDYINVEGDVYDFSLIKDFKREMEEYCGKET